MTRRGESRGRQRWPGRPRPPVPTEPPAWWRCFVLEDWVRPGDEEVRYPAGARMPVEEVARRRWQEAQRRWASENGMSIADWLVAKREARLGVRRPTGGRRRVRIDDE